MRAYKIVAAMDQKEEKVFSIWVSWTMRVISFQPVEGFEERRYPSHDEMFRFALQRIAEDYKIQ